MFCMFQLAFYIIVLFLQVHRPHLRPPALHQMMTKIQRRLKKSETKYIKNMQRHLITRVCTNTEIWFLYITIYLIAILTNCQFSKWFCFLRTV